MAALVLEALVLVASVGGLWFGARALVAGAVDLARGVGLSELVVGLTVVSLGTSSPELVVTTDAALAGLGDIAVGNIVGSNVFNLAGVLGVASLVQVVPVERSLVHRDGVALVVATLLGAGALLDLTVSRPEGLLLVVSLVAYTAILLRSGGSGDGDGDGGDGDGDGDGGDDGGHDDDGDDGGGNDGVGDGGGGDDDGDGGDGGGGRGDVSGVPPEIDGEPPAAIDSAAAVLADRFGHRTRDLVLVGVGLGVVLASGHFLVDSAATIARAAGLSEWVVGGTIVAAGTSTPELAVSLVAMGRGSVDVSVGNVVGSNVFNTLGVLGVGALLRPLSVTPGALESVAWLTVLVFVTVAALWSGRKLSRVEGGLFALSEVLRWGLGLAGLLG